MKHHIIRHKFIISIALGFLGIGVFIGAFFHKETVVVREGTPNTPAAMSSVNLMLDYGDGKIKTWNTVSWHEVMSVQDLLETVAAADGIVLRTEADRSGDPLIASIDGYPNELKTKMRWQYWINNVYEPRVASKYYLRPGDIVLWKYVIDQTK